MKKSFYVLLILLFSSMHAHSAPTNLEIGTDRPGADYTSFNVAPDVYVCKAACENDDKCQAFTYVHPGVQGPSARCWLKVAAPNPISSGCCYSGVKQITRENGFDRPGGDFRNFDLPWWATAEECASHCRSDTRCVAYTYVHPNHQGPNPRCWLKNSVPNPVPNATCDSGTINWR